MMTKRQKRKKILLIEDDLTMVRAIQLLLKSEPYDLSEIQNGHQALQTISRSKFDLIITDLFLNGITGLDIFRRCHHQIPVLIITGFSDSPLAQQAKEEAGEDFLEKSFSPEDFREKIRILLRIKNK
jgi:DNA-binding response OmpR family regulator